MSDVIAGSSPAPSAAATPSGSSGDASSSAPASVSVTPAASGEPSASSAPSEPGPVPYARFKEINDKWNGARDAQEKYERLKWAESFHQQPYEFVESWMDQLAQHAEYSPKLLAKAARMLQSRRGQNQPVVTEEPQPNIPIQDGNGNITGYTFDAKQLKAWQEWNWSQRETALNERLQPLEQRAKQAQQEQQQAAAWAKSQEWAKTTLSDLERDDPYFKDHKQDALQALADHPEWGDDIHRAYLSVLRQKVYPQMQSKAESKVLADLKTQANGGSVRPDGTGTGLPDFKKMKPADVMKFMEEHPDVAAQFANR